MSETTVMNSRCRVARSAALWSAALLLVAACDGDGLKPTPPTDPAEAYWDLELNHHAVTLSLAAPHNTITLAATPRNYKGEPLSGLPAPEYRSSSPATVSVLPDGKVTAVQATAGSPGYVLVYATLTVGNVKHRDSVLVRVVDDPDPPVLTTFSIHPIPPDSAKSAAVPDGVSYYPPPSYDRHGNNLYTLVRAMDADGNPIPDLIVDFRSSDRTTAVVGWDNSRSVPFLLGSRPGTVELYASVTAFGVRKVDTLPYRIGWPLTDIIAVQPATDGSSVPTLNIPELTIGAGGAVAWSSRAEASVAIAFSDATNVAPYSTWTLYSSSEIAAFCETLMTSLGTDCTEGGSFVLPPVTPDFSLRAAFRIFHVPGAYEYSASGATGRIVVVDER